MCDEISHSLEQYGVSLASAVADRLARGDALLYGHRDYCGMGLQFADGQYLYGEVIDGSIPSEQELSKWYCKPLDSWERLTFHSRSEFVEWLAAQSNYTLSGTGTENHANQRITKQRLESFARNEKVPWS